MRQTHRYLAFALLWVLTLSAQPSSKVFEAASIKPAPPMTPAMAAAGQIHYGMKVDRTRLDIGYWTIADLICAAYKVKPYQVSGPAWLSDAKWDILASLPEGASPGDELVMLRALLAERFGLKVHRETRDSRIYALETATEGMRLRPSPADEDQEAPVRTSVSADGKSTVTTGGSTGRVTTEMQPDGSLVLKSSKLTMELLAQSLTYYLDRPVLDRTGLPGSYQMELTLSAADIRFAAAKSGYGVPAAAQDSEPVGASLVSSVRKLGLRLNPQVTSIETIVVDHADRIPSAN